MIRNSRRNWMQWTLALALGLLTSTAARADSKWFACTPTEVMVFPNSRLHVRCENGSNGIFYFAQNIKEPQSGHVLSLLTTALATSHPVNILFDPADQSGKSFGCETKDCRLLISVAMLK